MDEERLEKYLLGMRIGANSFASRSGQPRQTTLGEELLHHGGTSFRPSSP